MADEIEPCTYPILDVTYVMAIGATFLTGLVVMPSSSTYSITYIDKEGNTEYEYTSLFFSLFDDPDGRTIIAFIILVFAWLFGACFCGIYGAFYRIGIDEETLPRVLPKLSLSFACLGSIIAIALWFTFSSNFCKEAETCEWETGAFLMLTTALVWYICSILLLVMYCCRYLCCLAKVHCTEDGNHQDA